MSRPKRPLDDGQQDVFTSPPIVDRGSTFIAAFSTTRHHRDLQALPDFQDASHRMAAWRVPSGQQTLTSGKPALKRGHDDDGEARGGQTLAQTLDAMNVEGSVVVARWWGGVMLGPARFAHIDACARRAIIAAQEMTRTAAPTTPKKPKLSEEEQRAQQTRLVELLERRDESITVLRDLLAEKKNDKSQSVTSTPASSSLEDKAGPSPSSSQQQHQDAATERPAKYAGLSLEALRRVEAARDRTISFLLSAIDKAEADAAATSGGDKATANQGDDKSHDGVEDEVKTKRETPPEEHKATGSGS